MKHFLGIEDEEFIRGKVPMTKKEIRILTLAGAKITLLESEAPAGLERLPERLDAAIIGGTGSHLEEILEFLDKRLKPGGFIVINCITVQTLASSLAYMREKSGYLYDTVQVQVNRLKKVGPYDMAEAINPVYIISCHKANV